MTSNNGLYKNTKRIIILDEFHDSSSFVRNHYLNRQHKTPQAIPEYFYIRPDSARERSINLHYLPCCNIIIYLIDKSSTVTFVTNPASV